jgi:hypothetical protein
MWAWVLVWIVAVWLGLNTLLLALAVGFGRDRPKFCRDGPGGVGQGGVGV